MSIKKEGYRMSINDLVLKVNDVLTGSVLIIALVGIGLLFTFKLGFIQIRGFKDGWNRTFGGLFSKKGDAGKDGMSSFQALATAIAAQVGTGNIAGAATAIAVGGPGAIFWMWISAFLGMATIYGEAVLAQTYKTEVNGEVTGGPVYYIKAAFKGNFGKVLSTLFAIFIVLALGFMGNMVQSNSIGAAFTEVFQVYGINIPPITIGLVLAVLAGFIFIGGTKRLAAVVEKVVPVMAGVYIVGSLILIGLHINHVPTAFMMIIKGAFDPKAVMGAGAGITVREAIRFGVARGLFSNEAGMGSAPNAAAKADVSHPAKQGLVQMLSVFIDTLLLCTATAMMCMSSGIDPTREMQGAPWVQASLQESLGAFGPVFITVAMVFFAFTTLLGNCFYCDNLLTYIHKKEPGKKFMRGFRLVSAFVVFLGAGMEMSLLWDLSDVLMGVMALINIPVILILSGTAFKAIRDYEDQLKRGVNPVFKSADIELEQKTDFWN